MRFYQHYQTGAIIQFIGWAVNKDKEQKAIIQDESKNLYIVDQDIFVSKETHKGEIVDKYKYLGDF